MEESTSGLLHILDGITNEGVANQFLEAHRSSFRSFSDFFNHYIAENSLEVSEIVASSTLAKSYAYEMLSGTKSAPSRDRVIALCLAARMDRINLNRALSFSGNNPLSPKNDRDCCIIICINNKHYAISDVDAFLVKHDLTPLETSNAKKL